MKQLYFFVIALFLSTTLFGQQNKIDSLKNELSKNISDKKKQLAILDSLSLCFSKNNPKTKESLIYYEKLKVISKQLKNYSLESQSYRLISEYYLDDADSLNAIKHAKKALEIAQYSSIIDDYYLSINQLGRVYHDFQKFDESMKFYDLALDKYENTKDKNPKKIISTIYLNLSNSLFKLNKSKNAIDALFKGYDIAKKIKDKAQINYIEYAISFSYLELEMYNKSESYFKKTLENSIKNKNDDLVGFCYHGMGLLYSRWSKFELALNYNLKALSFMKKKGNVLYEFDVLNNLAVLYDKNVDYQNAEFYANKALNIAKKINNKFALNGAKNTLASIYSKSNKLNKSKDLFFEVLKDTLEPNLITIRTKRNIYFNLSDIYRKEKNFEDALKYYHKSNVLMDSINNLDKVQEFNEIETKYQTEKKEKENLQLKQDNTKKELTIEKQNRDKWVLVLGIIGLLIISITILWFYRKTKKQKELTELQKNEIEKQKTTIENLQKFLHHENKNNLSRISAFIDVAKDETTDEKIILKLNETQGRIQTIYEVHKQLYLSEDLTNIKFKNYIDKLVKSVQHTHDKLDVKIVNNISENLNISTENIFSLGLIFNELITNAFKHAFSEVANPEIYFDLKEHNQKYTLDFKDNGKGLPPTFDLENLNSYGFELIKILIEELKGTVKIENKNGLQIRIEF